MVWMRPIEFGGRAVAVGGSEQEQKASKTGGRPRHRSDPIRSDPIETDRIDRSDNTDKHHLDRISSRVSYLRAARICQRASHHIRTCMHPTGGARLNPRPFTRTTTQEDVCVSN